MVQQQQQQRSYRSSSSSSTSEEIPKGESSGSKSNTKATEPQQRKAAHPSKASPKKKQRQRPVKKNEHSKEKEKFETRIEEKRTAYEADTENWRTVLNLANILRVRDSAILDGGKYQAECISMFKKGISLLYTHQKNSSEEEIKESIIKAENNLGKVYFQANMFEESVKSCTTVLSLDKYNTNALYFRGTVLSILGQYEDAANDFLALLESDDDSISTIVLSGLSRILMAKESAVHGGWDRVLDKIPLSDLEEGNTSDRMVLTNSRKVSLNLFMFAYYDHKTKDYDTAFSHLSRAYQAKMSLLPPYDFALETQKMNGVRQVFTSSFFPAGIGSASRAPIFIIGFVRSGSTLLERVLDAHPDIVGTGEDSVFNGQLEVIRDSIVRASTLQQQQHNNMVSHNILKDTVDDLAKTVVDTIRDRWERIELTKPVDERYGSTTEHNAKKPVRFVDKMLTNYNNVGFIHLLFPNALILHVIREPMDSVFSAYKHDFPHGAFDHTSDFQSLAHMYTVYRDVIDHWDQALPGRVTHVKYEDMVHDMPGVAKAVVRAAGLPWDETVLDFHNKKHAVNTLSSTQVRKGVYTHSLQYWKRYEQHLQPLVRALGDRVRSNIRTTLPGYRATEYSDDGS